ncbi:hypothetical protein ERO13_D05G302832v2 [Gossypium hirsutum]|uniref:Uncharacterized protein n=3 Tax=Gossypium TaxID=3633 RepID=A0A5J5RJV3_GOSBA|nr:hypothetical protein ES319_D05G322200v1 [Gossypium barbadense]KAG4148743.1 hypothetical protein ERO13_D05G302832v2 [Gossypium hirsutum]TYG70774.1 hypothetical protein ES288_D05G341100v1 [Gossypium darwinii]TYI83942.1 hypothetical protein E1A91_D05G329100v1 [Gossypium mustelinum]KAB2031693.1 hypothetical protein ES319_D05G322200v1 [Gossypium barbadense]
MSFESLSKIICEKPISYANYNPWSAVITSATVVVVTSQETSVNIHFYSVRWRRVPVDHLTRS